MRTVVALGIAGVWAVSYVVAVAIGNYTGLEVVTPVMVIAATYLLGVDVVHRHRNGNGNGNGNA